MCEVLIDFLFKTYEVNREEKKTAYLYNCTFERLFLINLKYIIYLNILIYNINIQYKQQIIFV